MPWLVCVSGVTFSLPSGGGGVERVGVGATEVVERRAAATVSWILSISVSL